ncbi:MAG: DUF1667 domain-containing protein [Clostridium sp.]|nr:DUF1667 domain-containing protein [Clostridium sp.]
MNKTFTCILCPNGCEIEADYEGVEIRSIEGNLCPKGRDYAIQELVKPMRNIATSVLLEGGELPLASVRLDRPIPKGKIFEVMEEIKKKRLKAPVAIGDVVISDVLGTGANVIVTKNIS